MALTAEVSNRPFSRLGYLEKCLVQGEEKHMVSHDDFWALWSLKEAAYKASGNAAQNNGGFYPKKFRVKVFEHKHNRGIASSIIENAVTGEEFWGRTFHHGKFLFSITTNVTEKWGARTSPSIAYQWGRIRRDSSRSKHMQERIHSRGLARQLLGKNGVLIPKDIEIGDIGQLNLSLKKRGQALSISHDFPLVLAALITTQ